MKTKEAFVRIQEAFGESMKEEYSEWLATTDYDYEIGEMVENLVHVGAWDREWTKFKLQNPHTTKRLGFNLKASWYVTRIYAGPNPKLAHVLTVHFNAFK